MYEFDYDEKPKSQNILANLTPANKRDRIDLALRSTCKQVHAETEGLILKFNTITFSSTHISRRNSDKVRVRAARFHYLRVPLTMEAASFLYYEDETVARPCYTSAVVDVSQQTPHYPVFSRAPWSSHYCTCSNTNHYLLSRRRSCVLSLQSAHCYALFSKRIPTGRISAQSTRSSRLGRTNTVLRRDRVRLDRGELFPQ